MIVNLVRQRYKVNAVFECAERNILHTKNVLSLSSLRHEKPEIILVFFTVSVPILGATLLFPGTNRTLL
jgi:hypothetical protein